MKKIDLRKYLTLSTFEWIAVAFLILSGIFSISLNSRPNVYVGFIFAIIGIFLIGLFSNRLVAPIASILVFSLGFYIRWNFPQAETYKGAKLAAFLKTNEAYQNFVSKYFILILLALMALAYIAGLCGEILRKDRGHKITVNRLTYMAAFVAIAVFINSVRVGMFSFGGLPIILSGYILGPFGGFIVGGVSDIVGYLVRPSAFKFNLLFTLTSALTGLIPIMVTNLLGDEYPRFKFWKVLIGIFVGQMLTSVVLVPIFQSILYAQNSFWVYFTQAFVKQMVSIPLYAFLVLTLIDRLNKAVDLSKVRSKF